MKTLVEAVPVSISRTCGILQMTRAYFETAVFNSKTGIPFANRQDDRETFGACLRRTTSKSGPTSLSSRVALVLLWSALHEAEQSGRAAIRPGPDPLTGLNIRVGGNLYTPQKNNFGPVVGFAWQPKIYQGKIVVRGGFGINYNENEIAITANASGNPPNAVTGNFNCAYPFTSNPSCAGNGILYETPPTFILFLATHPTGCDYTFGSNNLPSLAEQFRWMVSSRIRRLPPIITIPSIFKISCHSTRCLLWDTREIRHATYLC